MEYYLALKRKEILTQATTRMNLEDIMLNEGQILCDSPLPGGPRVVKTIKTESRMLVARGRVRGDGEFVFNEHSFVWQEGQTSGDGWWRWLHNSMSGLHATEPTRKDG